MRAFLKPLKYSFFGYIGDHGFGGAGVGEWGALWGQYPQIHPFSPFPGDWRAVVPLWGWGVFLPPGGDLALLQGSWGTPLKVLPACWGQNRGS